MDVKGRIALLVQAQGARRASTDLDGVAKSTKHVGEETQRSGRRMRDAETHSRSFTKTLTGLTRAAKLGAVAATGLGVAIGVHAMGEFRESYKVTRQTEAAIKSTGGAARVSAKEIGDLANSISLKTGIDDEQIQAGQNLLLTFTKVRNEVGKGNDIFNQATQAATDMSVALGQDTKSSVVQLGKALNDPVKGITALQRVGVSFTADQKKMVAGWVKHGDTLKAQKYILRELNTEFGGSAAAQADPLDKATVAVNNLAEALGWLVGPPLMKFLDGAAKFVNQMTEGKGAGGDFRRELVGVGEKVKDLGGYLVAGAAWLIRTYQAFRRGHTGAVALGAAVAALVAGFVAFQVVSTVITIVSRLRNAWIALNLAMAANPVGVVVIAIAALGAALYVAYRKSETFRNAVHAVFGFIRKYAPLLVVPFGPLAAIIALVATRFGTVKRLASGAFNAVKDIVQGVIDKVETLGGALDKIGDTIKTVLPGGGGINDFADRARDAATAAATAATPAATSTPTISAKRARGRATGGYVQPGETTLVGEQGPEVIRLPAGTEVVPHHKIRTDSATVGDRPIEVHAHMYTDGVETARGVARTNLRTLLAQAAT